MDRGGAVAYGIADDQGPRHGLLDRVQEKTSAWEARNSLRVQGRGQCTQSRVHEVSLGAQFESSFHTIVGRHQRLVRNSHRNVRHVARADPLLELRRT
jgi:hypothetical protein